MIESTVKAWSSTQEVTLGKLNRYDNYKPDLWFNPGGSGAIRVVVENDSTHLVKVTVTVELVPSTTSPVG